MDVIKILQWNGSEAETLKKNPLVPDILFRMPIKDNVTCKMCKLLLAPHLPLSPAFPLGFTLPVWGGGGLRLGETSKGTGIPETYPGDQINS